MRIGSILFLLLLALFGFGFLLSHSITLNQELTDAQDQLAHLQTQQQALEVQYQALLEERNRLTSQVSSLTADNENLRTRVSTLEAERQSLTEQIETLQKQLNLAQRANPILNWLVSAHVERLTAALLVVPILPLSLGAVYIMTYPKGAHFLAPTNNVTPGKAKYRATLTREELQWIARRRMGGNVGPRWFYGRS